MSDFSYLKAYEVKAGQRAWFTFHEVEGKPALECFPATEENKSYYNALLSRSRKMARAARRGQMTAKMLQENRAEDLELYPKHVLTGQWRVRDAGGNEVPFSPEDAEAFLRALPGWLFDRLRTWCADPGTWVASDDIDEDDIEDTAGN